jgi:hypothetical protein
VSGKFDTNFARIYIGIYEISLNFQGSIPVVDEFTENYNYNPMLERCVKLILAPLREVTLKVYKRNFHIKGRNHQFNSRS